MTGVLRDGDPATIGWKHLDCPEPAIVIPLLVNELGDAQRREPAGDVLLKFLLKLGPMLVLPRMLPGLEDTNARPYTRRLIVQMVDTYQQHHMDLLPHIVRLFEPAAAQAAVRTALRELLTHELVHISLPALINGLQEQPVIEDCTRSLVTLVNFPDKQDEVLQAVLQALRDPYKRRGAHITLVSCAQLAAKLVYVLLWDDDSAMNEEARSILAEMGEIAFPFIHQLAHDSQHLSDAEDIFMRMSSPTAAKGLLPFLVSNDIQEMEMAFYLLYMRIDNEYRSGRFGTTIAMLRQVQEQSNSDVRLRLLATLLFFNSSTQGQQRKKIAEHIVNAIKSSPEYHTEFLRALLLLGTQAIDPLANTVSSDRSRVPSKVYLEAVGTLGMLEAHPRVTSYVKDLAANAGGMATRDFELQELGLRAFGGLLVSGIYNLGELMQLQQNSRRDRDVISFEFYDVLLGKRNMPEMAKLSDLIRQRDITIAEQQERINTAEARAKAAETRASTAENHTRVAEARARDAEARARDVEQRANSLRVANRVRPGQPWQ